MIVTLEIPIYGGDLTIGIGKNFNKLGRKIGLAFNRDDISECNAISIEKNYLHYCIFILPEIINSPRLNGIIAHEAKHIVNYIFANRGVKLDVNNDEAECYFLGSIVNQIHIVINQYNEKHKKS